MDWELLLTSSTGDPRATTADFERVLASIVGPVTAEFGERDGNPMDYWTIDGKLTATGDVRVVLSVREWDNPCPQTTVLGATISGGSFERKLATWYALRDELAKLGCKDDTLAYHPAPIVDEADPATAARLRAEITKALIANIRPFHIVLLEATRPDDIDAVLAAYDAKAVDALFFRDCGLRAFPAGVARFQNLTDLRLAETAVDEPVIRNLSLPKLTQLAITDTPIRRLRREEVAGFPLLEKLYLVRTGLEELDIIDVCPKLNHVEITDTPLARRGAPSWPGVTFVT